MKAHSIMIGYSEFRLKYESFDQITEESLFTLFAFLLFLVNK